MRLPPVAFTLSAPLLLAGAARAQNPPVQRAMLHTAAEKIANAMAAAPAAISANATIMDWPSAPGTQPAVLRQGTNGWTCFPDEPGTDGNDPMCLDGEFTKWVRAMVTHTAPQLAGVGIGYMIAPGGASGSNTDPYAMAPTADNQWGFDPPHLMIVVPDVHALAGMPTTRTAGAPWVMWSGTPYAHIMAPVTAPPPGY
jgi:hypothetical protein